MAIFLNDDIECRKAEPLDTRVRVPNSAALTALNPLYNYIGMFVVALDTLVLYQLTVNDGTTITDWEVKTYYSDALVSANTSVTANTAKVGITPTQASDISANNLKVGITPTQASDILTNNAKVGITPTQASDIVTNTAKVSFDSTSSTRLANTSGTNTGDQDLSNLVDLTNPQSISGNKTFTGSTVAGSLAAYRPVGANLDVTGTPYLISTLTQNQFYNCDASGGAVTIDVDANDAVAPIGTEFEFSPIDLTNDIEFVFSNSQAINSVDGNLKLDEPFSGSILKKTASNTWTLIGTLKA